MLSSAGMDIHLCDCDRISTNVSVDKSYANTHAFPSVRSCKNSCGNKGALLDSVSVFISAMIGSLWFPLFLLAF